MKFYNSTFPTPFTNEMANRVEYIMNDPRKTSQEIQELLQNIKTEVEIPQENREGTPEGLKYPLVRTAAVLYYTGIHC
jgi:hypothetical protein